MDSLLCDEKWVVSPYSASDCCEHETFEMSGGSERTGCGGSRFGMTQQERDAAIAVCLEKEMGCMPGSGFVECVEAKGLVFARTRVMQWLIKCRSRLKLSYSTIFLAANYFDRLISICKCQEWQLWIAELVSIACLSVASKFNETLSTLSIHEIQMEDLDHSFQPSTIQRMELMLLQMLGWRLVPITAYSYVELLTCNGNFLTSHLHEQFITKVNDLLLHSLMDINFAEFRPSVIAASAFQCGLDNVLTLSSTVCLTNYIHQIVCQDQREIDLMKCQKLMEVWLASECFKAIACGSFSCYPSSPVTVLLAKRIDVNDDHVDLSIFMVQARSCIGITKSKKTKRLRKSIS
ncbi:putative cyclin-D7-1 [Syzygium oleosum]|uniref:putative cyclin-D7-1 n=1 Tax=Syzygium oleosum TaxID=219896 RepID=UPI0024B9C0B4|nr:putative cyclin-D7-1 [Syzygium oleosum]